jgi:hypothetical protein
MHDSFSGFVAVVGLTQRISRGAALRAGGWMRLFDDDVRMA